MFFDKFAWTDLVRLSTPCHDPRVDLPDRDFKAETYVCPRAATPTFSVIIHTHFTRLADAHTDLFS